MEKMTPSLRYALEIGLKDIGQKMEEVTSNIYLAKKEKDKEQRLEYINHALTIAEPAFKKVEAIRVRVVN